MAARGGGNQITTFSAVTASLIGTLVRVWQTNRTDITSLESPIRENNRQKKRKKLKVKERKTKQTNNNNKKKKKKGKQARKKWKKKTD